MEVIHSVIAPALYSLLVSLPPPFLCSHSLHPSTPSLPPSLCGPPSLPSRFTANSCSFFFSPAPSPSLLLLLSPLPLPLHSSPSAKNFPLQTRGLFHPL
ncbi:hypothetical protein J6895_03692 [Nakaseomyces glabratus]|nr:hypothetical protein J6895_03692 [Nakaseomyces glabratus]